MREKGGKERESRGGGGKGGAREEGEEASSLVNTLLPPLRSSLTQHCRHYVIMYLLPEHIRVVKCSSRLYEVRGAPREYARARC